MLLNDKARGPGTKGIPRGREICAGNCFGDGSRFRGHHATQAIQALRYRALDLTATDADRRACAGHLVERQHVTDPVHDSDGGLGADLIGRLRALGQNRFNLGRSQRLRLTRDREVTGP